MTNLGFCLNKQYPDQGWTEYISKEAEMMQEILEIELPLTPDHILMLAIKKNKVSTSAVISKSSDITNCDQDLYSDYSS